MQDQQKIPETSIAYLRPEALGERQWSQVVSSPRYLGSHQMMLKRLSRDPVETRLYQPGDQVNLIDWRAFARTDQMVVRQRRDDAGIAVELWVSVDDTMNWPDRQLNDSLKREEVTKFEMAWRLLSAIAFMHARNGDLVTITLFEGAQLNQRMIQIKSPAQLVDIFSLMEESAFDPATLNAFVSDAQRQQATTRLDRVRWVLSDFLTLADLGKFCLETVGRTGFFHVLSRLEIDSFWLPQSYSFFDDRHAKEYEYDDLLVGLKPSVEAWRQKLQSRAAALAAPFCMISEATTEELIVEYLMNSLAAGEG